MRVDEMTVLFDYMYWVNHRLLEHAADLPVQVFTAPTEVTTRNLRATLVHELDVEWSWRRILQGPVDEDVELDPEHYPNVPSLVEHWQRDESEMRAWLGTLTDEDLASEVYSAFTEERRPLWQFLLHIVTHAAQQQADAATLLTLSGRSPGELAFLDFLDPR